MGEQPASREDLFLPHDQQRYASMKRFFRFEENLTVWRLAVKEVTGLSDEYKLNLFSPKVVIPPGKSER